MSSYVLGLYAAPPIHEGSNHIGLRDQSSSPTAHVYLIFLC